MPILLADDIVVHGFTFRFTEQESFLVVMLLFLLIEKKTIMIINMRKGLYK